MPNGECMERLLKWLSATAGIVVLGVAGLYGLSRVLGASNPERAALALVDAVPEPGAGRDGFAALYTAGHDVPETRWSEVLAQDVGRFAATVPSAQGAPAWTSALEQWPVLDAGPPDGAARWCSLRADDCLAQVRDAPDAYAELLARNAALLDRAAALRAYGHFANPFPPRPDMPLPAFQPLGRLLTRTAWHFSTGQVDLALDGACADAALGRRMIEAGDSLVGSVVGAALVQGNAGLLAQMLAELPRSHPLPVSCRQAFAQPLALEQGICRTMLAEGRFVTGALRAGVAPRITAAAVSQDLPEWALRLLFDPDRTAARMAPGFAAYCGEQARGLLQQDRPLSVTVAAPSRRSLRCLSNAFGCVVADIQRPAYDGHVRRLQDARARLRSMAALLHLRGQDAPLDTAALEQLPAALRGQARPLELDLEAATLAVALYEDGNGAGSWALPLPASRLQPGAPSP